MTDGDARSQRAGVDYIKILSGAWSATDLERSLKVIAEGVCDVAGFGVAALNVLRDTGHFEVIAVAGDTAAEEQLLGNLRPFEEYEHDLADAQEWGPLRFVPHEAVVDRTDDLGWVSDFEPLDHPDAWQPLDLLFAPLHGPDGTLVGTMAVDLPADGLRPGPERQAKLVQYVRNASLLLAALLERDRVTTEVRLATTTRHIIRAASGHLSLDDLLSTVQPRIVGGFRAEGMWLQAFDHLGHGRDTIHSTEDRQVELPEAIMTRAHQLAIEAWALRTTEVLSPACRPALLPTEELPPVLDFLESINVATVLLVPLGVGDQVVGVLVLSRNPGSPEWSSAERDQAQSLGNDLGQAVFNARAFERERHLRAEIQALERYKSNLIATVSHEFKTPLTGLLGHLELLDDAEVDAEVRRSLNVIERSAQKLSALSQDLLLLSRAGDPDREVVSLPVDLRAIVEDFLEINALEVARRDLAVTLEAATRALALGEASELERVCANLLSNAIKYSRDGGAVRIRLDHTDQQVVLTVSDDGLGISADDQERLFSEFFRSTNPEALHQPGTGLGLAIVKQTVERHRGTIDVESELGVGTTFTVTLPAAAA